MLVPRYPGALAWNGPNHPSTVAGREWVRVNGLARARPSLRYMARMPLPYVFVLLIDAYRVPILG